MSARSGIIFGRLVAIAFGGGAPAQVEPARPEYHAQQRSVAAANELANRTLPPPKPVFGGVPPEIRTVGDELHRLEAENARLRKLVEEAPELFERHSSACDCEHCERVSRWMREAEAAAPANA